MIHIMPSRNRLDMSVLLQIGDWVVDGDTDTIRNGATIQKLEHRSMEVLLFLAKSAGRVVTKDDLIVGVWNRAAVTDHAIAMVISQLRKALEDDARTPKYIETITKRGYRLVCAVREVEHPFPPAPAEHQPSPKITNAARSSIVLWPAALVALAAAAIAIVLATSVPPAPQDVREQPPQFVVADFVNTTGAQHLDHIAYALNVHVALALQVGEPAPVVRWRDDGLVPIADVRKILGRDGLTVVTGTLAIQGGETVIGLKVGDPSSSNPKWTKAYRLEGTPVDALAGRMARDVALASGRPVLDTAPSRPFPAEVHDLFWRAYYARHFGGADGPRQSIDILSSLVDKHPDYVPGRQLLAYTLIEVPSSASGVAPHEAIRRAREQLAASSHLQGGVTGWTAFTEAWLSVYADRDLATALRHARAATKLNAASALAWQTLARIASLAGEHDEALSALGHARKLDLANFSIVSDRTWMLYAAGRAKEAERWHEENKRLDASDLAVLALVADAQKKKAEALTLWTALLRGYGIDAPAVSANARGYEALVNAIPPEKIQEVGAHVVAMLAALAGDQARASKLIRSLSDAREGIWSLRLHQAHVLAPLMPKRSRVPPQPQGHPVKHVADGI